MKAPVAVTGGSGFIGREVIARLVQRGWPVRALLRRSQPDLERAGVVVIRGALENEAALERLVAGAAAVVHCAGAVRAPTAAAFRLVNAVGSAKLMAATAAAATRPRFLLLSSLAAREPTLSPYAESKRLGEDEVRRGAGQTIELCIVRPPAVYGPGDRGTLPVFRQLRNGLLFVPAVAKARFSLIYVGDLAEMVVQLLETPAGTAARSSSTTGGWMAIAGRIWPRLPVASSAGACGPSLSRGRFSGRRLRSIRLLVPPWGARHVCRWASCASCSTPTGSAAPRRHRPWQAGPPVRHSKVVSDTRWHGTSGIGGSDGLLARQHKGRAPAHHAV